jgi:hypothetical protein
MAEVFDYHHGRTDSVDTERSGQSKRPAEQNNVIDYGHGQQPPAKKVCGLVDYEEEEEDPDMRCDLCNITFKSEQVQDLH